MLRTYFGIAITVCGLAANIAVAADLPPSPTPLEFSLIDLSGKIHSLQPHPDVRVSAVVFLSTECPIVRSYVPSLNRLSDELAEHRDSVRLFGVISDPSVSRADAKKFADEFAIKFPVLFDASGQLAFRLQPSHVPEAFVLDADSQLVYRGRIDDTYAQIGKRRPEPTEHNLREAIQAVMADKALATSQTKPVGCLFEFWEERDDKKRRVTFTRDIAPIVQANCLVCHREGEVGPFALSDYQDVAKRADQIVAVTQARQMPPWMPADGHGNFIGRRGLTDFERQLLEQWVSAGAPKGDAENLPPAPEFVPGWRLGEPNLVLTMAEPFDVPADGPDIFQNFVIPIDIPHDKLVAAVDVHPGRKTVVHHLVLFLDSNGKARQLDAKTPEYGYSSFGGPGFLPTGAIGGWSPGNTPRRLPGNMGRYLKKGSDLVMQVHYHPSGKAERDQTKLGVYFVDKPKNVVAGIWAANYEMDIPAGNSDYRMKASYTLPEDVLLVGIVPHMHLIGKSMKAEALLADGSRQSLVWIKDWNYNWQDEYHYRKPLRLPKGTRLEVEAAYDNSDSNPANPSHPPKRVTWGEETTNEMFYCFFLVATEDPKKLVPVIFDNLRTDVIRPRIKVER